LVGRALLPPRAHEAIYSLANRPQLPPRLGPFPLENTIAASRHTRWKEPEGGCRVPVSAERCGWQRAVKSSLRAKKQPGNSKTCGGRISHGQRAADKWRRAGQDRRRYSARAVGTSRRTRRAGSIKHDTAKEKEDSRRGRPRPHGLTRHCLNGPWPLVARPKRHIVMPRETGWPVA